MDLLCFLLDKGTHTPMILSLKYLHMGHLQLLVDAQRVRVDVTLRVIFICVEQLTLLLQPFLWNSV